jgi:hypothetical protein
MEVAETRQVDCTVAVTLNVVVAVAATACLEAKPNAKKPRATAGKADLIGHESFKGYSFDVDKFKIRFHYLRVEAF